MKKITSYISAGWLAFLGRIFGSITCSIVTFFFINLIIKDYYDQTHVVIIALSCFLQLLIPGGNSNVHRENNLVKGRRFPDTDCIEIEIKETVMKWTLGWYLNSLIISIFIVLIFMLLFS